MTPLSILLVSAGTELTRLISPSYKDRDIRRVSAGTELTNRIDNGVIKLNQQSYVGELI